MPNIKIVSLACLLIATGIVAAFNAKWIRDGLSPWWTSYFISLITATTYVYSLRANLFEITYTSAFQTFFFHASWYLTTIFVLGEVLSPHRMMGLGLVFIGMIMMSIK